MLKDAPQTRKVLEAFEAGNHYDIADVVRITGYDRDRVTTILWRLFYAGRVKRVETGHWYLAKQKPALDEAQTRLLQAIVTSGEDVRMGELARRAGVPRERLRRLLDSLVRCGAVAERADGWYKVL
jgi:DNA-binding IclR family transcriptional regulator